MGSIKVQSQHWKSSKKFKLSSWKLMCKVDLSKQACIRGSQPVRRLLSSSPQLGSSWKRECNIGHFTTESASGFSPLVDIVQATPQQAPNQLLGVGKTSPQSCNRRLSSTCAQCSKVSSKPTNSQHKFMVSWESPLLRYSYFSKFWQPQYSCEILCYLLWKGTDGTLFSP